MAGIGNTYFDLIDLYKSQEPDGSVAEVIEMLTELNPILDDAQAIECNNGTKHLTTIRTGLPSVTWGQLYKGIAQSKSTKAQVEDTTGFVEALSSIDCRLLDLSNNEGAVRLSEAQSFLEAMNQEVASKMFYGSTASDPEQFMGLAPRYNDQTATNGNQIIDGDVPNTGSGDNTSIWFVTWGDNFTNLLYPKGTMAGVQRVDKGEQRVTDGSSNAYYVKEEMFTWHVGLSVRDWRYNARIANIDVSRALADPSSVDGAGTGIYDLMRQAYWQLQNRRIPGGRQAIYCNRDMMQVLDAASTNAGGSDSFVRLVPSEIEGKEVLTYRGIPIRETDAIVNTEAHV